MEVLPLALAWFAYQSSLPSNKGDCATLVPANNKKSVENSIDEVILRTKRGDSLAIYIPAQMRPEPDDGTTGLGG
jgi:hypothetical protein